MSLNEDELKLMNSNNSKAKKPRATRTQQQQRVNEAAIESKNVINTQITKNFDKAASSLQGLDAQLDRFERKFAESAVQRVNETPARIAMHVADLLEVEGSNDPLDWQFSFEAPDLTSLPRGSYQSQLRSASSDAPLLAS